MKFDLHLHSYYSDGQLSPSELLEECKKVNLEVVSLTDHESVGGIPEALAAGEKLGVRVIPGIEFDITDHTGTEQHLLGLFIDCKNSRLSEFIEKWEITKKEQIKAMIKKLQAMGFELDYESVLAQAKGSLHRSHIGSAVFKGPQNRGMIDKYKIAGMSDFFARFLKKDAYVERERPSAEEVIGLIKSIGGLAVWAHPMWKDKRAEAVEERIAIFKELGLDCLEVGYPPKFMAEEMSGTLREIAKKFVLFETGGSDFHSFNMDMLNKVGDFQGSNSEINFPF